MSLEHVAGGQPSAVTALMGRCHVGAADQSPVNDWIEQCSPLVTARNAHPWSRPGMLTLCHGQECVAITQRVRVVRQVGLKVGAQHNAQAALDAIDGTLL
jgi:hypothetical protein